MTDHSFIEKLFQVQLVAYRIYCSITQNAEQHMATGRRRSCAQPYYNRVHLPAGERCLSFTAMELNSHVRYFNIPPPRFLKFMFKSYIYHINQPTSHIHLLHSTKRQERKCVHKALENSKGSLVIRYKQKLSDNKTGYRKVKFELSQRTVPRLLVSAMWEPAVW